MNSENKVVTRFAPSPTGFMHVGNLRTAIFAYLWAKKNNGKFILRIEDTDREREVEGARDHVLEVLRWLDLNYDEGPNIGGDNGPYTQSERLDIYQKYAKILIEKGYAYVDAMSEEDAEEKRKKDEEDKKVFLYRNHRKESEEDYIGIGQTLRFKVKEAKRYYWNDVVFGDLSAGEEAVDDIVLIKKDGYPTYNFAHIVDDIEMGVTHVMRGKEYVSSTPKYLSIYEALEINPPIFVSLPHILGKDGNKKLGKRDGAKDVLSYREDGYLGEALFNFLAFLGFNPGGEKEIYSNKELSEVFDINRIQKASASFNEEKLNWYNKEYIKLQSNEDQIKYIKKFLPESDKYTDKMIERLRPIFIDRINHYGELKVMHNDGELEYYLNRPVFNSSNEEKDPIKIIWKKSDKENTLNNLNIIKNILEKYKDLDDHFNEVIFENIWQEIYSLAEEKGKGDVLWPLRYSLSGKEKSPDPKSLLYILGINESLNRVENSISSL